MAEKPEDERTLGLVKELSWLDRLLFLWVVLAMGLGIILGEFTGAGPVLNRSTFIDVSLPLAIGLLVMMWPILCRISYTSMRDLFKQRQIWWHLLLSLIANWVVAPLFMLALGWAFLPDREDLRQGLVLVGIARCIAAVLIWTDIAKGDRHYTALLVAINSVLQIILYAPLAILYINIFQPSGSTNVTVSYATVARSVAAFLGIPCAAAIATRTLFLVILRKPDFFKRVFLPAISPLSLLALLFTIIIIFAAQGKQVVQSITDVLRVAAPLLVYFAAIFVVTLLVCRRLGFSYALTAAQSFTAASNNFELAIAVAVASYGPDSAQALATTVGPLIEVPALLSLAHMLIRYRKWRRWDLPANEDTRVPLNRDSRPPYVLGSQVNAGIVGSDEQAEGI